MPNKFYILTIVFGAALVFSGAACSASPVANKPAVSANSAATRNNAADSAVKNTMNENADETNSETSGEKTMSFYEVLDKNLNERRIDKEKFCDRSDQVTGRILREYGALFLAAPAVSVPPVCMFTGDDEVNKFQGSVATASEMIAGANIELQAEAMKAYLAAREEAVNQGLDITPRDGAEAGKRSFADTLRLWNSRFEPACAYWQGKGKLTAEEIQNLKALPVKEQVKAVLELEKKGIYFNTRFDNSILYSVAAPGTSQHLSMLALDVNEYGNKKVREILNKHGWFRTVKNDDPHFTFLGFKESELKKLGLKKIADDFWVPGV